MFSIPRTLTAILAVLVIAGCSESASDTAATSSDEGHDHGHEGHSEHDHPKSLADGLKELAELRDTVKNAFSADDVDTAHGPLHDVGHLLEDITGLFEGQELSQEQKDLAKESIDSLFDLFGGVDRALHGQDGTTYADVSDQIDAAITALQGIAEPEANPSESTASEDSTDEVEGNESDE